MLRQHCFCMSGVSHPDGYTCTLHLMGASTMKHAACACMHARSDASYDEGRWDYCVCAECQHHCFFLQDKLALHPNGATLRPVYRWSSAASFAARAAQGSP